MFRATKRIPNKNPTSNLQKFTHNNWEISRHQLLAKTVYRYCMIKYENNKINDFKTSSS